MKIQNTNRVIYNNGDTNDIIKVVMMAYDIESDNQIFEMAEKLKGDSIKQTCRNIWKFLIENINYKADSDTGNGEMIRTPARFLHDKKGDCKSYSLFTAVILRYLNIPHVFRFTSYNQRREATHVYVVASESPSHNGEGFRVRSEIVIDAVAAIQIGYAFNKEKKYSFKCDMSNGNTKISYLAGLNSTQANAIGAADSDSDARYAIWSGDDNLDYMSPGKAWLYCQFDLLSEQIAIATSNNSKAQLYNELAIYAVLIQAYNFINGDTAELEKFSSVICGMIAAGDFTASSTAPDFRDSWFSDLHNRLFAKYKNGDFYFSKTNGYWHNRILDNLILNNVLVDTSQIGSIGAWTPLQDALKKAGIYFLYLFIPEDQLRNYPPEVAKKRNTQNIFFSLIHKIDIFHNADTVFSYFRSGIIARTGMEPEAYIKKIKASNIRNIGSITLASITAIVSLILGVLSIIKAIWPNSQAAQYAVSSGAADLNNELFTAQKSGSATPLTDGNSSTLKAALPWIPLAALALGTFFMSKKS
jgi:hypothetical protein